MTREPYFYKRNYDTKFRGDKTQNYQKFEVQIGNARMNQNITFSTEAPLIKYHQESYNSCCLSSLSSAFHCPFEYKWRIIDPTYRYI